MNVPVVLPAAIVTDVWMCAALWLLDNDTVIPPGGAALVRVTVPIEDTPPTTVVGFRVSDTMVGGLIVSWADWVTPLNLAVIVATACAAIPVVLTANVADVFPPAIVIEGGTVAEIRLLDNRMVTPFEGAGPVRVTVPTDAVPPVTVEGFSETD